MVETCEHRAGMKKHIGLWQQQEDPSHGTVQFFCGEKKKHALKHTAIVPTGRFKARPAKFFSEDTVRKAEEILEEARPLINARAVRMQSTSSLASENSDRHSNNLNRMAAHEATSPAASPEQSMFEHFATGYVPARLPHAKLTAPDATKKGRVVPSNPNDQGAKAANINEVSTHGKHCEQRAEVLSIRAEVR